jgi:predicted ATPase
VYFALRNDYGTDHWATTLEYVKLGLGADVVDVAGEAIPGGGAVGLALEVRGRGKVPAVVLSDGELAYLAFVALFRLQAPCSLLAFDEPDLHLHPRLLVRVVQFFETMGERHPVLLATQSDALLDSLSDPAKAVRVCELEQPARRTRVSALDRAALDAWLKDYRGVGHLRGDGYLSQVLQEE